MKQFRAHHLISTVYKSSTLPVILETDGGKFFVKLHGTAQGASSLIAEIIAAHIAETLGLNVPERVLIHFDQTLLLDDKRDELADLIRASYGLNLGFAILSNARDFLPEDISRTPDSLAATILWLDGLIMNPDRTRRNPNIMIRSGNYWLIDHGAALPFQYNTTNLHEEMPRKAPSFLRQHLFHERLSIISEVDETLSALVTRQVLEDAVNAVPDIFFQYVMAQSKEFDISRKRQLYIAFLWKRLKSPRYFVQSDALLS